MNPPAQTMMVPLVIAVVIGLAVYVWLALALGAVFTKAGKETYKAWIPGYNLGVVVQISGIDKSPWLLLVPIYNIVIWAQATIAVSHKFGRTTGFGVLGVLLAPVWASILGWGSARWLGRTSSGYDAALEATGWSTQESRRSRQPQRSYSSRPAQLSTTTPAFYDYEQSQSAFNDQGQGANWHSIPAATPVTPASGGWDPFAPLQDSTDTTPPGSAFAPDPFGALLTQEVSAMDSQWPHTPAPASSSSPPPPVYPTPGAAGPPVPPLPTQSAASAAAAYQAAVAAMPPPPLPMASPAAPVDEASSSVPVTGQPRSTRMHEDAEVVAQARRAQTPPPLPLPATDLADDDGGVRPIIVPGNSEVPAPAVPALDTDLDLPDARTDTSGWQPGGSLNGTPAPAMPVSALNAASAAAPIPSAVSAIDPDGAWGKHGLEPGLDTSAQVSAVVGAPDAGSPRSARSSVAAQQADVGVPHSDDPDHTIVGSRSRPTWVLKLPVGSTVTLTSDYVILGRRPGPEPEFPSAQLIPVADGTRTISKTHAVLALVDGTWMITDLGSTNGTILVDEAGHEDELTPHEPARLTREFLLGDAELTLELTGA